MPPSTVVIAICVPIARSTAAVSTGKLLTPDSTKTPAAFAAASNAATPKTKSAPSAKSR